MENLLMLLNEVYPTRYFSLKQIYERDEVYNIHLEYQLYIEEVCSEYFPSFHLLENFVVELYTKNKGKIS
jgi:hypothetical protein